MHARHPSIYSRVASQSESPIASDRSLRHVGEGALDDSDSSDAESEESHLEEHVELAHKLGKLRSMSVGRGPAHPSPLSRLAGQQQWTEEEEEEVRRAPKLRSASRVHAPHAEEDEASPSPLSTDTDGEQSDNSEGEDRHRVMAKSRSITRSRSRKSSGANANARRLKSRSRSSTVASLAAPVLSPPRSSRSVPPIGSPKLSHIVVPMGSPSSVETVIAASIREQEVALDDAAKFRMEPASWAEMSQRRKVDVVEEEHQLREVGWRALQEALEEYADQVCFPVRFVENPMLRMLVRVMSRCAQCSRLWLPRSSS